MNMEVSIYTADSIEEKFLKCISRHADTHYWSYFCFLYISFSFKRAQIVLKKRERDENKTTDYCRLHSESVLGKLQIKVSRGGFIYLCGLWGSVYLK